MHLPNSLNLRRIVLIAVVLAPLVGLAAIAVGMAQESHDDFCASCHTLPESDYYARSVDHSVVAPDLASSHAQYDPPVKCIDCHGGAKPLIRARTFLSLAVWDTVKYYTGQYKQPARLHGSLPDENCLQCHEKDVAAPGFDNHFHNKLSDPKAPVLHCTDCHPAHQPAIADQHYISRRVVYPQCNSCHIKLGEGPANLQ